MEVISFDGLSKLSRMSEAERPDNWKSMVVHYLTHKWGFIKRMEIMGRDTYRLEMQFIHALRIAKRMGVYYGRLGG